jgi:hypothetical protein
MTEERDELGEFAKQGRGVREVLQAVEDALIDAVYDDFMVATERARADTAQEAKGQEPEP